MLYLYIFIIISSLCILSNKPARIVPIIVVLAVLGCGPGIGGRYFLDEAGIAISILFVAITSWREFWSKIGNTAKSLTPLDALFVGFAAYYAGQSARTFAGLHEWSALIYGAYFLYVVGVYAVLRAYGVDRLQWQRFRVAFGQFCLDVGFSEILAATVIAYNLLYVGQGLTAEFFAWIQGVSGELPARFSTQGISWSGSAYAVLPNLLSVALMPSLASRRPILAALWLGSLIVVALVFDSRVALALAGTGVLIAISAQLRTGWRSMAIVLGVAAILGVALVGNSAKVEKTVVDALRGVSFLVHPRIEDRIDAGDYDRYAHFRAGFLAIGRDPCTLLLGYGTMMHRVVLGEHIVKVFMGNTAYSKLYLAAKKAEAESGIRLESAEAPERNSLFVRGSRSTSFTSMLVDGGLLGILLMYSCLTSTIILTLRALQRRQLSWQAVAASILSTALLMGWPTVVFLLDVSLFWLLLMPLVAAPVLGIPIRDDSASANASAIRPC